jgi:hypothetical protein
MRFSNHTELRVEPGEVERVTFGHKPTRTQPTTQPAATGRILIAGTWRSLQAEQDPGDNFKSKTPVHACCPMLEVSGLNVVVRDGRPRIDVRFQFRDGKAAGGALFKLELEDRAGKVLGTARVLELRNREMERKQLASVILGGDDPPNRTGKAECYFDGVAIEQIGGYRLEVWEPDAAELIGLLTDRYGYVRESAARALGQFGPPAQAALPMLKTCLEDGDEYVRKAAARAVARISAGGDKPADHGQPGTTRPG